MNVTIGMSAYNLLDYSKETIETIFEFVHDYPYKLVVVDDNSNDGVSQQYFENLKVEALKQQIKANGCCLDYKYIRHDKNLGAPTSWNEIMEEAGDGLAIIINNDIVPGHRWLYNLVKFMEDNPDVGLGASHVIDDPMLPNRRKPKEDYEKWLEHTKDLSLKEKDIVDEGIHGCCIAVTKECRDAIGGFDPAFIRTSYEDCDYVVRANNAGFLAQITHSSLIYHYGGTTQKFMDENEGGLGYQFQNRAYFEKKWNISLYGLICSRAIFWRRLDENRYERAL